MATICIIMFGAMTPFWVAFFSYETVRLWRASRAYALNKGAR